MIIPLLFLFVLGILGDTSCPTEGYDVGGTPGRYCALNGGYVEVLSTSTLLPNVASYSIEFWARMTANHMNRTVVFFAGDRNNGSLGASLRIGFTGELSDPTLGRRLFVSMQNDDNTFLWFGAQLQPFPWTHFAVTLNGASGTATSIFTYVNGTRQNSTSQSIPTKFTGVGNIVIGGQFRNGVLNESFFGEVDDIRVWNRVLTPPQTIANAQFTRYCPDAPNLQVLLQFDNDTITQEVNPKTLAFYGNASIVVPTSASEFPPVGTIPIAAILANTARNFTAKKATFLITSPTIPNSVAASRDANQIFYPSPLGFSGYITVNGSAPQNFIFYYSLGYELDLSNLNIYDKYQFWIALINDYGAGKIFPFNYTFSPPICSSGCPTNAACIDDDICACTEGYFDDGTGCTNQGCMDPASCNYQPLATVNFGCNYSCVVDNHLIQDDLSINAIWGAAPEAQTLPMNASQHIYLRFPPNNYGTWTRVLLRLNLAGVPSPQPVHRLEMVGDEPLTNWATLPQPLTPNNKRPFAPQWRVSSTEIVIDLTNLLEDDRKRSVKNYATFHIYQPRPSGASQSNYYSMLSLGQPKLDFIFGSPVPAVTEAYFNDDTVEIYLVFNDRINNVATGSPPTTTLCSTLFNTETNNKLTGTGPPAQCQWLTPLLISISGSVGGTIVPGDSLTFNPGVIASKGGSMTTLTYQLAAPLVPAIPSVTLVGPSLVGLCVVSIQIDAQIFNLAGRPAQSFAWKLNGAPLNQTQSFVTLLRTQLLDTPNLLELYVTNVYNQTGVGALTISKAPETIPLITLRFPARVYVSQSLTGQADVIIPTCNESTVQNNYTFAWSSIPPLSSLSSQTSTSIFLPPPSLTPGITYNLTCTIFVNGQPKVSSSVNVVAAATPIVALIAGGDRQVSANDALTLDGSSSYDPDTVGRNISAFQQTYSWSCFNYSSNETCDFNATVVTGPKLSLPANFGLGAFKFSLVFTSSYLSGNLRTATAAVSINFGLPTPVPDIIIQGDSIIAPTERLRLQGLVASTLQPISSDLRATWSEIAYGVNVSDLGYLASPLGSSSLVLKNGLLKAGFTYVFQLTIQNLFTNQTKSATFSVLVHAPPGGGYCGAQSAIAIASSPVQLFCRDWISDVDSPLRYSFSYYLAGGSPVRLTDFSASQTASVYLPVGNVTIVASIGDNVNTAVTMFSFNIQVVTNSTANPECVANQLITTTLSQAQSLGQSDSVLQLIRLVSSILLDHSTTERLSQNVSCNNEALNQTVQEFRAQIWNVFLETISRITSQSFVSDALAEEIADVLLTLVGNIRTVENQTNSSTITEQTTLTLQMLGVILSNVSSSPSLEQSLALILSELLEIVQCSKIEEVVSLLTLLSQKTFQGVLPEEVIVRYFSPTVTSTGVRLYPNYNLTLKQDDLDFNIPSDMLAKGGYTNESNFVDLTVTRYGAALGRCRKDNNTGRSPDGPVITITIRDPNGTAINVTGVDGFSFWLPVDRAVYDQLIASGCSLEQLLGMEKLCYWWNETAEVWTDSGCTTRGGLQMRNNQPQVFCQCSHLTDFAVLLHSKDTCNVKYSVELVDAYHFFTYFYVLLALIALAQAARMARVFKLKSLQDTLVVQHLLIFFVAVSRCINSARIANDLHLPSGLLGLVVALPYMFVFWIYTLLVFQWAAIYHHALREKQSFTKVKPWFFFANILVLLVVLMLFISISSDGFDNPTQVARAGSIIMAIITTISGLAFGVYGNLIANTLRRQQEMTSSVTSVQRGPCFISVANKMTILSIVISAIFIAQSVTWVASIKDGDHYDSYTVVFLTLDCAALISVLLVFKNAVSKKANPDAALPFSKSERPAPQNARSARDLLSGSKKGPQVGEKSGHGEQRASETGPSPDAPTSASPPASPPISPPADSVQQDGDFKSKEPSTTPPAETATASVPYVRRQRSSEKDTGAIEMELLSSKSGEKRKTSSFIVPEPPPGPPPTNLRTVVEEA